MNKTEKRGVGRPVSKALRPERMKRLAKLAKGRGWSLVKLAAFAKVNYISLVKALEREGLKDVNHRSTKAVKVKRTVKAKKAKVVKAKRKYTRKAKPEATATTAAPATPAKKRGRPAGSKNKVVETTVTETEAAPAPAEVKAEATEAAPAEVVTAEKVTA
jgi:hypothetical protein